MKRSLISLLLLILGLAASPALGQSGDDTLPDAAPTNTLPLQAASINSTVTPECDGSLDEGLRQLAAIANAPEIVQAGLARQYDLRLENGRVQVQVAYTDQAAAETAISAGGGQVSGRSKIDTQLQAWVSPASLADLAADPAVTAVRRPAAAEAVDLSAGSVESEGVLSMNAAAWHTRGRQGAGTKIAVIDVGFIGYAGLLGSDLPAAVTARNFVDGENDSEINTDYSHGTAVAEIIHDVAPQAQLTLIKINTSLDLEQAVDYAIVEGLDVISTSLIWYNATPGDGTGYFADLVQEARTAGILWITAAGNDREHHWGGTFVDPDNDGWHNFNGEQEINYFGPGDGSHSLISAGKNIRLYLRWNDWTEVDQDLDIFLMRYDSSTEEWVEAARSAVRQTGLAGQRPTEMLSHTTSGDPAAYGIQIKAYSVDRQVDFDVIAARMPRFDELVTARSLGNLADAPLALTVGAVPCHAEYEQLPFSSEGPTNGPGGSISLEGAADKPEITAYSTISTAIYAPSMFSGTSASAPHVSGAAALVLGAFPTLTVDQLEAYLLDHAEDLGDPGYDTQYGYGRLNLPIDSPTAIKLLAAAPSDRPAGSAPLLLLLTSLTGLTAGAYRLRRSRV